MGPAGDKDSGLAAGAAGAACPAHVLTSRLLLGCAQCQENGDWMPVQNSVSLIGSSWCVYTDTGIEIPGTRVTGMLTPPICRNHAAAAWTDECIVNPDVNCDSYLSADCPRCAEKIFGTPMVCASKWSVDKTSEEHSHRGVCKIDARLNPEDQAIIDKFNQDFQNGSDAFNHDILAVSTTTRVIDLLYSSVPFSTTPTLVN